MLTKARPIALAVAIASLLGCSAKPPPPTVHASMTQAIAPIAQTIWDITNAAYNARGDGLDPTKLSPSDWDALGRAGAQLQDSALVLAQARHIAVVDHGQAIMGEDGAGVPSKQGRAWDTATAKKVQAWIDANPTLFAQRAKALADSGKGLIEASHTKDIRPLYQITSGLDDVCDGCHKRFWGTDEPPPFLN